MICSLSNSSAQHDSIKVVVECDSLYRPFWDFAGEVKVTFDNNTNDDSRDYEFELSFMKSFKIPKPKRSMRPIQLRIRNNTFYRYYLTGQDFKLFHNGYSFCKFDYDTGNMTYSDIKPYQNNSLTLKFPTLPNYDKYLIDNTCSICHKNDSVSWIEWGLPLENATGEEVYIESIFNPYNNPMIDKEYNGGCTPGPHHWYCHRCKKEY